MKIMHFDMGKEWRGGQRQCALLHSGLLNRGVQSKIVANIKGEIQHKAMPPISSFSFGGEVSLTGFINIAKIIRVEKPDIVHSHEAHSLTPLVILKKFMKFHLVHTRRVDFHVNKGLFSSFKYINPNLNLVAVSKKVKQVLVDDGVNPLNIEVIYDGVPAASRLDEEAAQRLRGELNIPENATVFGTVANFAPHKGLPTMLYAFKHYLQKDENARLIMVGEGPLYKEIRTLAHMQGLTDKIIFTGFQDNVPAYMSLMDIFLVSSELEGLNSSIIDAMHLGLPVVATEAGGIVELVEDGHTGYLAPVNNPELFADRMRKLAQNEKLMHEFSEKARQKAANFTDDTMVDRYITLYRKLVDKK